jgi:CHAT domain-containing protein
VDYDAVSEKLDERPYDVLHYAGHAAYVEDRPEASGFVLAGRKLLTPEDFATRQYVPRLVVANACHSAAAGKPVGASSENPYAGVEASRTLVSGLLTAGSRAFVGAQWQVPDRVAVTFAGAFYEAIASVAGGPQPIGEAMRRGRRAVCDAHPGHPAWAAYALYGNPWRTAL